MTTTNTPPLALTMGDPAGIGPDITLALWSARRALALPPFLFIGDAAMLRARAETLGLDVPVAAGEPETAATLFAEVLPVLSADCAVPAVPGARADANV